MIEGTDQTDAGARPLRLAGIPAAVRDEQLVLIRRHLDRAPQARATLDVARWWAGAADECGVRSIDRWTETVRDTGVVMVDQMRPTAARVLDAAAHLRQGSRVVFCEIASFESSGLKWRRRDPNAALALDPVDVTGLLWMTGLSVIDVDRVPVRTRAGVWQLVGGVARPTPPVVIHDD